MLEIKGNQLVVTGEPKDGVEYVNLENVNYIAVKTVRPGILLPVGILLIIIGVASCYMAQQSSLSLGLIGLVMVLAGIVSILLWWSMGGQHLVLETNAASHAYKTTANELRSALSNGVPEGASNTVKLFLSQYVQSSRQEA